MNRINNNEKKMTISTETAKGPVKVIKSSSHRKN